jgi:hypothetical protein
MPREHSPGPQHGLPREFEKAPVSDWSAVLNYLDALTKCERPIVAGVTDDRVPSDYLRQLGYLRSLGEYRPFPDWPVASSFAIDWPQPGQLRGSLLLYEHLFDTATLHTVDGDDYFWFYLSFGALTIFFEDSNRW